MSDLISRQAAIEALTEYGNGRAVFISVGEAVIRIEQLPPAEPQIIRCKDCAKHNKRIGDYEELPVGGKWIWKENACPLIEFRGKAQGHEFDYQFCAFGERRTE